MKSFKIPFWGAVGFLTGIAFSSYFYLGSAGIVFLLTSAFFLGFAFKKKRAWVLLGAFFILFFLFGAWITELALQDLLLLRKTSSDKYFLMESSSNVAFFNEKPDIKLYAKVIGERDFRETYMRYRLKPVKIEFNGEQFFPKGKILIFADRNTEWQYGDIFLIEDAMRNPINFADFDYQGYLAKEGISSLVYFPKTAKILPYNYQGIEKLQVSFFRALFKFKDKIRLSLMKNFSSREAGFLRALLLGDQGGISENFRSDLSRTGTSHLVSVSGLHLAIFSLIIFEGLIFLGFWRKHVTWLTIFVLMVLVIFFGFRASVIRASIMASIFLIATNYSFLARGEFILLYAACLMLFFNPLLLRYDIGFQLSFLAIGGIILLGPFFEFFSAKFRLPNTIVKLLSATFAAQIFTLPLIIYNFKTLSLIGFFLNLPLIFFLPWLMGIGLGWSFLIFLGAVQKIVYFLLLPAIHLFIFMIDFSGNLKWSAITFKRSSSFAFFALFYYFSLVLLIIFWQRFKRRNLTPLQAWKKWRQY